MNELKCPKCGIDHIAGSSDCEAEKNEKSIKGMPTSSKVGRRRVLHLQSEI